MNQLNEAFTKISQPEEVQKILKELVGSEGVILCKGQGDEIFRLKATRLNASKLFFTITSSSINTELFLKEKLILNFSLGNEKYFFQSKAQLQINDIYFELDFQLFHLQRRQSYRVLVPSSLKSKITLVSLNGVTKNLPGTLHDISSHGCRAVFNNQDLKLKDNDQVVLLLDIGQHKDIEAQAVVRHMQTESLDKNKLTVGLEFKPLNASTEAKMFSISIELYRDHFSKI